MVTIKMNLVVGVMASLALTSAAFATDGWLIEDMNIVSGDELKNPHVWLAAVNVKSWEDCNTLCAANASCLEFDYAASWNQPEIGYNEAMDCGFVGSCYFRSDLFWPGVKGTGCNHTAGRRPGLPPAPGPPGPTPTPPPTTPPKPEPPLGYQPNIVFILTDDQDTRLDGENDAYSDIGSMAAMKSLQKNFLDGGVRMENGFVATSICCPSRTETFTGRHLHNVLGGTNCMWADTSLVGDRGVGLFGRLTDQGYTTGLFGKITNDAGFILKHITAEKSVSYIDSPIDYNDYTGSTYYRLFENGTQYTETLSKNNPVFGTPYQTTQIGNRSLAWIREVANGPKPFFAYLGPHAPHYPAQPAPWYVDAFPDIKIPITPNYNISSPDKTQHVKQNPPLTALAKCWEEQHFRDRWQTLLSVDDIVTDLFSLLDELKITDKTFVIYSSDHGYKQGQWRIGTSKEHPYETDIHVPLLFKGPGIPAGVVLPQMTGNIDIMPTILDLAGGLGVIPNEVDGKSMLPLILPSVAKARNFDPTTWRDYFLVEYKSVGTYYNDHSTCFGTPACALGQKMPRGPSEDPGTCIEGNQTGTGNCYFVDSKLSNSWRVLRIINAQENIAYVEYDPTFEWVSSDNKGTGLQYFELYDVAADPYQMSNMYFSNTTDADKIRLHGLMTKYYACKGNETMPNTCG
eukprot:m.209824 g.209824  ORF g.209824 m.209824 type:complete len:684 (+) comp33051_c0_seq1:81-2132(+)